MWIHTFFYNSIHIIVSRRNIIPLKNIYRPNAAKTM